MIGGGTIVIEAQNKSTSGNTHNYNNILMAVHVFLGMKVEVVFLVLNGRVGHTKWKWRETILWFVLDFIASNRVNSVM
jgi:hypothetical protein